MRILQVHGIAHIPQLIAKVLTGLGYQCEFVENVNERDVRDYDIVHAHYALNWSTINAFKRCRKHKIPFVLHCHGSDVRVITPNGMKKLPWYYQVVSKYIRKKANSVILATPDLCEFSKGTYIPNPVDIEIFKPMPSIEKTDRILIAGRFLYGSAILKYLKLDKEYDCINYGDSIQFPKNVKMMPWVPYEKLPSFLNRYREMIAVIEDPITMTRLSAMACRLKTFNAYPKKYTIYYNYENPDEVTNPREFIEKYHNPMKVCKVLIGLYESLL